jgi:hypothetical protein
MKNYIKLQEAIINKTMKAKTAQPITQPSSNTVRDYNMLLIKAV